MSGIKDLHGGRKPLGGGRGPGRPVVVLETGTPEDVDALLKQAQSTLDEAVHLNNVAIAKIDKLQEGADGKSAYELYLEKGGELSLEEWLASLHGQDGQDADIAAAEAATTAANKAAAAANAATDAAIAAEATRQQAFETNEASRQTAAQNAEANRNGAYENAEDDRDEAFATSESQRTATFTQNESGRSASVTAAQAAATAAATSAESANQKFTAIQEAISGLDPSQSTSDAVAAEAVTRAAADAQMAADIAALGPEIDQIYPDVMQMREVYGRQAAMEYEEVLMRMNANTLEFAPQDSTHTAAYEVKAGRKYHISATITWANASIGAVGFYAGDIPSASTHGIVIKAFETGEYSADYTPEEDGHLFISFAIGALVIASSFEVTETEYVDFRGEIAAISNKVAGMVDTHFPYSVSVPATDAKNTISAGSRCDIGSLSIGDAVQFNITRTGGMVGKSVRIWLCSEPNSQNSSTNSVLDVSASEDSVIWTNDRTYAIKSVAVYVVADSTRTSDGALEFDINVFGAVSKAGAIAQEAKNAASSMETQVESIATDLEAVKAVTTGNNYEYSANIPALEAKNTISAGQRCDISEVASGKGIHIEITRSGGMVGKKVRVWLCSEPNSQNSSTYTTLEVSASEDSADWVNNQSYSIKSIALYAYADDTRTTEGSVTLEISTIGVIADIDNRLGSAESTLNNVATELEGISSTIEGNEYEYSVDIPAANAKNTTTKGQRCDIGELAIGDKIHISVSKTGGMVGYGFNIYYCAEANSQNLVTYESVILGADVEEFDYINDNAFVIKSIAIYVAAASARSTDGNLTLNVSVPSVLENHEERIKELEDAKEGKVTLADVFGHWMSGEKFPIGFHGDSTTDGVGTTGWTTDNSHPAQDEAEGGTGARGVVDYVCQLAYPYILEKLLQSELGNNNLRVYNIGYYGASLINNLSQLSAIYADVYADVKMVGITLSINDRGSYSSDGEYFNGLVDFLTRYVNFFVGKGITPFMVTQQLVTQNGNDPGNSQYGAMYRNHVQEISNLAKRYVAKKYDLEVIDMNEFGRLLMKSSAYAYTDLTEDLHFRDLGHRLEAGFLFSELVPWVNKSGDAKTIYFGFNCANNKTGFRCGNVDAVTNDKFKSQLNYTRSGDTSNVLIFDAYMFVNSKDGAYNVKYLTPRASGYIVLDGDTSNPITIDSTEMTLQPWDIGLHHVQVYTGASEYVAFKGFLLEQ